MQCLQAASTDSVLQMALLLQSHCCAVTADESPCEILGFRELREFRFRV